MTVSLDENFAAVLKELPGRLRQVLGRSDFTDRVTRRLFPKAYDDEEMEAEYRHLLGEDLRQRKLENVKAFEHTLKNWKASQRQVHVRIGPGDFELWLGFINDMRLVLGTELDIQDDSWERDFDPAHPHAEEMQLLDCLGWLQEALLQA